MAALDGLGNTPSGEAGGELAIACRLSGEDAPTRRDISRDLVSTNVVYRTRVHFAFCIGGWRGMVGRAVGSQRQTGGACEVRSHMIDPQSRTYEQRSGF